MKMISLIWAMSENRVIGKDNQLPWHLPGDLQFFKETTLGHPVAMGRRTWLSLGRPLPGRENIVITRNTDFSPEQATVLNSIEQLITYSQEKQQEVFVIGGAQIYQSTLPYADKLYITKIHAEIEGDTSFPSFDLTEWKQVSVEKRSKDEKMLTITNFKYMLENKIDGFFMSH